VAARPTGVPRQPADLATLVRLAAADRAFGTVAGRARRAALGAGRKTWKQPEKPPVKAEPAQPKPGRWFILRPRPPR
jgi:hypothetical protein